MTCQKIVGRFRAKKWWSGYLFACITTLAALALRKAFLHEILGEQYPFLLIYISVITASWYGGLGPGLLATAFGGAAEVYFFGGPLELLEKFNAVGISAFVLTGVFISIIFEVLRRAQSALRKASRQKDVFMATLAHELRNPLAPISNALAVLRTTSNEGTRKEAIEVIVRHVPHIVQLVDDLMDTARIEENKIVLRRQPVRLSEVVDGAVEAVKPLMTQKNQDLRISLPPAPVWLDGDITRLVQIFTNLLNNASKYTDMGGSIRIDASHENGGMKAVISDNGIGISPEMLPRIFSMFEQADFRSGRSRGGIGIGLALVKQLTLLHGGSINAHSDGLGKGSQFIILLPAIELPASASVPAQTQKPASPPAVEAPAAPSAPAQIQQPPLPVTAEHCHVLVVDDNVDAANTMAWMLELMGCDVKTANDGQAALETAQSFGPEVILLDIGLPGMDGYKVCEAMRRVPSLKNTTIIAQTGYGQHKDRQLSHEAGFDDHLVKPVSMEALQKVLDSRPAGNPASYNAQK